MSEEELIEKNNILLSHNNLPKGMTTCENYGLSGNCGLNCPLFKNKSCEVYDDVVERIITNLDQEIKKLKKEIKKYINSSDFVYDELYKKREKLLEILGGTDETN